MFQVLFIFLSWSWESSFITICLSHGLIELCTTSVSRHDSSTNFLHCFKSVLSNIYLLWLVHIQPFLFLNSHFETVFTSQFIIFSWISLELQIKLLTWSIRPITLCVVTNCFFSFRVIKLEVVVSTITPTIVRSI